MTAESNLIGMEELIFFIDLTTDFIKKKKLMNQIQNFIENKNKINNSSFGIVIFQEDDNPVWLYEQGDAHSIVNIIDEKYDSRPKNQSYIENGLFEILSYIFKKSREVDHVYRVIVLSDTPSTRSEEYHNALYDLIVKSKKFSTVIDIIRITEESDYIDEVKLKVISSETQGGMFICNDIKQFEDILSSLIKSKKEFNIIQPNEEDLQFLDDDKEFYERLAVDLISLDPNDEEICDICQFELCPLCGAYSDEIHKCFNCGTRFHSCCISKYAITNNIGFKHILRCPKCQSLLKIDEEYVDLVFEEEFEGREPIVPIETTEEHVQRPEESQIEPELESYQENEEFIEEQYDQTFESSAKQRQKEQISEDLNIQLESILPPPAPPKVKKIRIGGYFGQEIDITQIKKKKGPIKVVETRTIEDNISITKLKPPKKRASLRFCKICGCSVKHSIYCPNCGAKIE
ncbi:MAG: hypothetical protein EU542_04140 [Promethearchaeota archaeon]|nr:MAG: hypothetical protein EU542_04140 [Candidatus Lokiarchaeota archaeon]